EVAAQNCADKAQGAFTGEVSVLMLADLGVKKIIIGHSERRQLYGETNIMLKDKINLAIENNLTPVFCCGEAKEIRDKNAQNQFVFSQLEESVFHLSENDFQKIIIAYEPIWAIGTGVTATPEQAQEMHAFIRASIAKKYSPETANAIPILYGGSINASCASQLFALADVDGGLVGSASLKADEFTAIAKSF
ncbi:MAG TPA: triose-phosphate isomerase, partial [Chitinophagales bacterium]